MRRFLRSIAPSVIIGALVGFVVLGIGGRIMMRIIAHWEGRVPVLTSGTVTVLLMGTLAGAFAGLAHGLLRRFVRNKAIRVGAFFVFCTLFTIRGVHGLLIRPQLLFITLTLVYCIAVEIVMLRAKDDGRAEFRPPLTA
ncbi:MAG TPA: hypothetical protein VM099_05625 [Gemmatimonadaceae bacterium]|nr:hypothetical protein [Gemmatimonadaceae bacterium]